MKIKVREIYERQNHQIHKRNLKNRSKCRIAGGTVSIILRPVSHTDDRCHTIDDQHTGTDPIGFTGKPQCNSGLWISNRVRQATAMMPLHR